jgi:hypothetical protein
MTWRVRRVIGVLLVAGGVASCHSPAGPSATTVDGRWTGTIAGLPAGSGSVDLALTQNGPGVAGTYALTFGDPAQNRSGDASGTIAANLITLALASPAAIVCSPSVSLSGTITTTLTRSGDRLSGSFAGFTCDGAISGTLELTRDK